MYKALGTSVCSPGLGTVLRSPLWIGVSNQFLACVSNWDVKDSLVPLYPLPPGLVQPDGPCGAHPPLFLTPSNALGLGLMIARLDMGMVGSREIEMGL